MNSFANELRYAVRRLRRAPGFSLMAILIKALGIGANGAPVIRIRIGVA